MRRIHLNAKVQEITCAGIEFALDRMMVPEGEERVLVCKGLQSLITPAEIIQLIRKFGISKIVLFSSACSGLKGNPVAAPYPSRRLSETLGGFFENVTDQYFDTSELAELDSVHRMLFGNYAWKSGHFPATKVEVFSQ